VKVEEIKEIGRDEAMELRTGTLHGPALALQLARLGSSDKAVGLEEASRLRPVQLEVIERASKGTGQ
jgi:hypothetical protein